MATLKNRDFHNWIKGSLAATIAKEGLTDFVAEEILDFHIELIQQVIMCNGLPSGTSCSSCTTANLLACPTQGFCGKGRRCNAHDASIPDKSPLKDCPKGLCNRLMEDIHREHRYKAPSWRNSDARRWRTDAFEICKCFLPLDGYCEKKSLDEVDLNGLLAIITNMIRFQSKIETDLRSSSNIFAKARNAVRTIRYSPDHLLSDRDLKEFLDMLFYLLQDQAYLAHDVNACKAVEKLSKLKMNELTVNSNDLTDVLQENLNVMFINKKEEIRQDILDRDLQTSLIEQIKKEQEKLLKQLIDAKQDRDILLNSIQSHIGQEDKEDSLRDKQKYADSMEWLFELFGQSRMILETQHPIKKELFLPEPTEPSYWNFYLNITEEDAELKPAESLKIAKTLPNQDQLNKLQIKFLETKSNTTADLLKSIEHWTTESVMKMNKNINYAWLAYIKENNGKTDVKLIIEMDEPNDTINLGDITYGYKVIKFNHLNAEAKLVVDKSKDLAELSVSDPNEIKAFIENNASRLMKDHKHLSIINASSVRSKGFSLESDEHTVIPENCLVLYVRKKGFIPIGELPFEKFIGGIPTDVREGIFFTQMQASNESEETLKMGCRIYKRIPPLDGEGYRFGTLGGFIDHPQYGLCGLTCAHVLLNDIEMAKLQDKGELTWLDFVPESASVYLLEEDNYIKIGRLVKAAITKGGNGSNGMEAAIFQIERFFPSSGSFVNVTTQADEPLRFDTGKAYGPSRFSSDLDVFKYGSTTGKTTGKFQNKWPVVTVRLQSSPYPGNLILLNQIEIKSNTDTVFSDKGDSGALVMIKGHNDECFCIGIVEGGTSYGSTIVTPVATILDQMDVTSMKCFESDLLRDTVRSLKETTRSLIDTTRSLQETTRSLQETDHRLENKLEEILVAIRQLNVRPEQT